MNPREISRRHFLKTLGTTATVGTLTAIGCGGNSEKLNPSQTTLNPSKPTGESLTQTPDQTKETEKLSDRLEILPFEILDHIPFDPDQYGSIPVPDEGFRFVIIKAGIKNISDKTLNKDTVDEFNALKDVKVTTSQGYDYNMMWDASLDIVYPLPSGFALKYFYPNFIYNQNADDYFPQLQANFPENDSRGGMYNAMLSFLFQVPQNASGLKLNIPGFDEINLDKLQTENEFNNSKDFDDIIGAEVTSLNEKVKVTVRDFASVPDPKSALHIPDYDYSPGYFGEGFPPLMDLLKFYSMNLTYTNLDQGYAQDGFISFYSISKGGIVYEAIPDIGFSQMGPGFSKDHTIYLAYPKEENTIKLILLGQELNVYNTPVT